MADVAVGYRVVGSATAATASDILVDLPSC
jgi:hypothetical protein